MKNSLVAIGIIAAILISSFGGYFAGRSQAPSTTLTSTKTITQSTTQYSTTTSTITQTSQSYVILTATSTSTAIVTTTPALNAPSAFGVEKWNVTINGHSNPLNFVAYNPNSSQIYISGAANAVTVVNAITHDVSGNFTVPGTYAGPIFVDAQTNTLVVFGNNCYSTPDSTDALCFFEINGNTDTVTRVLPLSSDYGAFAVDFATGTLYETQSCPNPGPHGVPNPSLSNCGFLYSYDLESGALLTNVSLNAPAYSLAVNPDTNMVYAVANSEFMIISGATEQVLSETPLESVSTPVLQVDASTDTVFALAENGTYTIITAIDGATGRVFYASSIGSACSVSSYRWYVNSATNQVYATGGNQTFGTDYLLVINASTGKLQNMLSIENYDYGASTFNPQLNETYLLVGDQLVALPAELPQTYINSSLLTVSGCEEFPA